MLGEHAGTATRAARSYDWAPPPAGGNEKGHRLFPVAGLIYALGFNLTRALRPDGWQALQKRPRPIFATSSGISLALILAPAKAHVKNELTFCT